MSSPLNLPQIIASTREESALRVAKIRSDVLLEVAQWYARFTSDTMVLTAAQIEANMRLMAARAAVGVPIDEGPEIDAPPSPR
jgi:hypothetical protein